MLPENISKAQKKIDESIIKACLPQASQQDFAFEYPTKNEDILNNLKRAKSYATEFYKIYDHANHYTKNSFLSALALIKFVSLLGLSLSFGLPISTIVTAALTCCSALSLGYNCYKVYAVAPILDEQSPEFWLNRMKHIAKEAGFEEQNKNNTDPFKIIDEKNAEHNLNQEICGVHEQAKIKIPLCFKRRLVFTFPQTEEVILSSY